MALSDTTPTETTNVDPPIPIALSIKKAVQVKVMAVRLLEVWAHFPALQVEESEDPLALLNGTNADSTPATVLTKVKFT